MLQVKLSDSNGSGVPARFGALLGKENLSVTAKTFVAKPVINAVRALAASVAKEVNATRKTNGNENKVTVMETIRGLYDDGNEEFFVTEEQLTKFGAAVKRATGESGFMSLQDSQDMFTAGVRYAVNVGVVEKTLTADSFSHLFPEENEDENPQEEKKSK